MIARCRKCKKVFLVQDAKRKGVVCDDCATGRGERRCFLKSFAVT